MHDFWQIHPLLIKHLQQMSMGLQVISSALLWMRWNPLW